MLSAGKRNGRGHHESAWDTKKRTADRSSLQQPVKELSYAEKIKLEKILGKKIEPKAFACYSTQEEYEQAMGLTM